MALHAWACGFFAPLWDGMISSDPKCPQTALQMQSFYGRSHSVTDIRWSGLLGRFLICRSGFHCVRKIQFSPPPPLIDRLSEGVDLRFWLRAAFFFCGLLWFMIERGGAQETALFSGEAKLCVHEAAGFYLSLQAAPHRMAHEIVTPLLLEVDGTRVEGRYEFATIKEGVLTCGGTLLSASGTRFISGTNIERVGRNYLSCRGRSLSPTRSQGMCLSTAHSRFLWGKKRTLKNMNTLFPLFGIGRISHRASRGSLPPTGTTVSFFFERIDCHFPWWPRAILNQGGRSL